MDITQLSYFITVVDCNYNLSEASKRIHLTQSALSQFISNFEKREDITLFQRKSNRLVGLTESGKIVYQYAIEIVDKYEEMTTKARAASANYQPIIKIGVPSLILMVFFSSFLPKLKEAYPNYEFKLIEAGSKQIQERLTLGDLDIGIILGPIELNKSHYAIDCVHSSEVVAYLDVDHPLITKDQIDCQDIEDYDLATFNNDHSIYQMLDKQLQETFKNKKIAYTASAWDYLIGLTADTNIITFLPEIISASITKDSVKLKRMKQSLNFDI